MVDIGILAKDILETIEREDAFINEMQVNGGFKKIFKAKNVKEVLNESWSNE